MSAADEETLLRRWIPGTDALRSHHRAMTVGAMTAALTAGARTGLIEALEEGGDAAALASRCGLDLRATQAVLDLYAALGLTAIEGGRHRLHPDFRDDVFGAPVSLSTCFWASLEPWLRTGERPGPYGADSPELRATLYRTAVEGLARMFEPVADAVADALAARHPAPRRVLDVGAGSGVWSLAMAARHPEARVTGFDLPPVLERFTAHAEALGLADRVDVVAGDLNEPPLPAGFDRVVLANVLHLEGPERAAAWTRAAVDTVAPGGWLVVIDALPGEDRGDRLRHAAYGLHLQMRTGEGRPHDEGALRAWMADAGLVDIERLAATDTGVDALVGIRP